MDDWVAFGQVGDLPFQAVDGQNLGGGYFKDTLNVYDDLVIIRIVFLKLGEVFLLVDVENLFLDSCSCSDVLFVHFVHVGRNHFLQARLGLDGSDLADLPDHDVFERIF